MATATLDYRFIAVHVTLDGPETIGIVYNKKAGLSPHGILGGIELYPAWKQWVFMPKEGTVWSSGCLLDIQNALSEVGKLSREHQEQVDETKPGR